MAYYLEIEDEYLIKTDTRKTRKILQEIGLRYATRSISQKRFPNRIQREEFQTLVVVRCNGASASSRWIEAEGAKRHLTVCRYEEFLFLLEQYSQIGRAYPLVGIHDQSAHPTLRDRPYTARMMVRKYDLETRLFLVEDQGVYAHDTRFVMKKNTQPPS